MPRPVTVHIHPEKLLRGIHLESVRQFGIDGMSIPGGDYWQWKEFRAAGVRINFEAFIGEALTKTQTQKYAAALRDLERQGLVTVWDSIRAMRTKLTPAGEARLQELGVTITESVSNGD